jgi:hypothetical protein
MRYCVVSGCRQDSSSLRDDGRCFAHGKEADGLMAIRERREPKVPRWSGPATRAVRLPSGPSDWPRAR